MTLEELEQYVLQLEQTLTTQLQNTSNEAQVATVTAIEANQSAQVAIAEAQQAVGLAIDASQSAQIATAGVDDAIRVSSTAMITAQKAASLAQSQSAQIQQIQYGLFGVNRPTLTLISAFDLNTNEVKSSAKSITGNFYSYPRRVSSNNFALLISFNEAIIFNDDNTTGIYTTKTLKRYGDNSQTGQDLVLGLNYISGDYFVNIGMLPTPNGQKYIINKQKI